MSEWVRDQNVFISKQRRMYARWCGAHKLKKVVYVYFKFLQNSHIIRILPRRCSERLGVSLPEKKKRETKSRARLLAVAGCYFPLHFKYVYAISCTDYLYVYISIAHVIQAWAQLRMLFEKRRRETYSVNRIVYVWRYYRACFAMLRSIFFYMTVFFFYSGCAVMNRAIEIASITSFWLCTYIFANLCVLCFCTRSFAQ